MPSEMINPIGIMQGRLSTQKGRRIQSFPVETWREEFSLAREAGLDCIEWVYEAETGEANPLRTDGGIEEIRRQAVDSGISVSSVCADYFMSERLVSPNGRPRNSAVDHLKFLLERTSVLGASHIVLPFVDESSLRSSAEFEGLLDLLRIVAPIAERLSVELHLETDLEPTKLVLLFERVSHRYVRANYDIGNSAALGRGPVEELTLLGPWLGSVHVKDRLLGGGTVQLGSGAADFPACFRLIHEAGFQGPFILQAAREKGINEIELAIRNRKFIEEQMTAEKVSRGVK